MAAGIATNCGDTYNDKEVIQAAKDGRINMVNLDNVCRTMLATMFRNELFEIRTDIEKWHVRLPGNQL